VAGAALVRRRRHRLGLVPRAGRAVRDLFSILTVLLLAGAPPAGIAVLVLTGRLDPGGSASGPPVPAAIGWAGAGAGAVLALAALGLWWNRIMRPWHAQLPIDRSRQLGRALTTVFDAAVAEWVLAPARTAASDAVRTLGGALETVAAELTAHAADLGAGPGGPAGAPAGTGAGLGVPAGASAGGGAGSRAGSATGRFGSRPDPAGIGAVRAIVRHDLAGLVLTCIDRSVADIRSGERDGVADRAGQKARALAGDYDRHLRRVGPQNPPPPPDWPVRPAREALVAAWWRGLGAFHRAVVADQPVQQLCSDEQVQLLSRDPESASTLAFAPRSASAAIAEPGGGEFEPRLAARPSAVRELVWTATGTSVGVLHLVPLRSGVEVGQLEDGAARAGRSSS
jgi:hypothetical protein